MTKDKYAHVHSGHSTDDVLVQFIEDALNIVKKIFVKSKDQLEQVGSFYLLYALYFKQPTRQFCKLRFTMDETTVLLHFYETLSDGCDQVRLIFWKLVQADAFRFVHIYMYRQFKKALISLQICRMRTRIWIRKVAEP